MSQNGKVKLVNIDKNWNPLFGNVSCGQMFLHAGELCVRTSSSDSGEWEAFSFNTNRKFHIPHTDRVDMVDCELRYKIAAHDYATKTI